MSVLFKPGLILFRAAFLAALLAASGLAVPASPASAQAPVGQIMALTPEATVTRGDRIEPLALKAPVYAADTISTNATGKLRILFNDDSAINLGPGTILHLAEYRESGAKPTFKAHLGQGLARLVTGKIVEANPNGFSVSTPEAAMGIRGTIISVRSDQGRTRVFVEYALRQVHVNGINVPGGQKITIQPGVIARPRPEPITSQDRDDLNRDLGAVPGGAAAAAKAAASRPDSRAWEETIRGPSLVSAGMALSTQNLGDAVVNFRDRK